MLFYSTPINNTRTMLHFKSKFDVYLFNRLISVYFFFFNLNIRNYIFILNRSVFRYLLWKVTTRVRLFTKPKVTQWQKFWGTRYTKGVTQNVFLNLFLRGYTNLQLIYFISKKKYNTIFLSGQQPITRYKMLVKKIAKSTKTALNNGMFQIDSGILCYVLYKIRSC